MACPKVDPKAALSAKLTEQPSVDQKVLQSVHLMAAKRAQQKVHLWVAHLVDPTAPHLAPQTAHQ